MARSFDTSLLTPLLAEVGRRRQRLQRCIVAWEQKTGRDYPWRAPSRSPYEVLIAELLLKRTTAAAAVRVYEGFLTHFPSFHTLAAAPRGDLEAALSTLGLQKQRANGLRQLAAFVLQQFGGDLPDDVEMLLRIPHLGPYAAGAVRSFAFGHPTAIVDSNVHRIVGRLFRDSLPSRPSLTLVRQVADRLLPTGRHRDFNFGLLDLGALVCRYRLPRCGECPLLRNCDYARAPAD